MTFFVMVTCILQYPKNEGFFSPLQNSTFISICFSSFHTETLLISAQRFGKLKADLELPLLKN